ncbi:MAG: aminotransferase class V-fold PLP-dependent enzyme [Candidatus Dormibacteraceae bacterium]
MTPADLRPLVPATSVCAYLNTATYGPAPRPVVEALDRFTRAWSAGSGEFEDWERTAEECRRLFAGLIHTRAERIAVQPFVSGSAGMVASQLPAGARVVVPEMEFTSNLWPWLQQRERGVKVTLVAADAGRLPRQRFADAIAGGADLVAVSAVQSSNGFRTPLAGLAELTHRAGGLLFVDACQAAGAIDLDPARDGFDILATGSYKWLMGPRGAGYLYLSERAQDRLRPAAPAWKSARDPSRSYYGAEVDLSPTASRFDSSLSWISMAGDREALRLVTALGAAEIERHDMALAARFRAGLDAIGLSQDRWAAAERSPIVAVDLADAAGTVGRLRAAGVIAAQRAGGARFSFHAFNDDADVDRALEALAA